MREGEVLDRPSLEGGGGYWTFNHKQALRGIVHILQGGQHRTPATGVKVE
jgi:hypothetical protein